MKRKLNIMRAYTKQKGTITKNGRWFTASFNVAAGILSKDFQSNDDAVDFLIKHKRN